MKRLQTERLVLRAWTLDDAPALYDYAKLPNVGPLAGWPPHKTVDESRKVVQQFIADDEVWAIVWKATDTVIGSVGLHHEERHLSDDELVGTYRTLGYVVHPDWWGRGVAGEAAHEILRFAFDEINVDEVYCCHYAHNTQSQRVIEKTGFTFRFKETHPIRVLNGQPVVHYYYSISEQTWRLRQQEERNR
ncbi:MAG: GNAT family N-acetyltransferase [Bacilli bacterium]